MTDVLNDLTDTSPAEVMEMRRQFGIRPQLKEELGSVR